MSGGELVGGHVGDLWVGVAPEQLGGGSNAEIERLLKSLAGKHLVGASQAFENAELQVHDLDESPDAFRCEYGDDTEGLMV